MSTYDILMTALFIVTQAFIVFIIVHNRKKYGTFDDQRELMFWANSGVKQKGAVQVRPSKWYNRFRKF